MNKTKKSKNYITIIKYPYNEYEYLQTTNYICNKNTTTMGQARGGL